MARPNPAIAQRKTDPNSTQTIVLGRVVACRALLIVTSSTFFAIYASRGVPKAPLSRATLGGVLNLSPGFG